MAFDLRGDVDVIKVDVPSKDSEMGEKVGNVDLASIPWHLRSGGFSVRSVDTNVCENLERNLKRANVLAVYPNAS